MSVLLMLLLIADEPRQSGEGKEGKSPPVEWVREPLEGMPIPQGGFVRIAYTATGSADLTGAALLYRVNGKDWQRRPLKMQAGEGKGQGAFNWRTGGFEGSSDPVEFYVPTANRQVCGGCFDLEARTLGLKTGDTLDFSIEITDSSKRVVQSAIRHKEVVSPDEFQRWVLARLERR
jgi:hypothetical protein